MKNLNNQFCYKFTGLYQKVKNAIDRDNKISIASLNINTLYLRNHSDYFDNLLNKFSYLRFDGYYAILWARLIGLSKKIEQLSADIFLKKLFSKAQKSGWSIYALGGSKDTVDNFIVNINSEFPNINILGHQHGYFKESDKENIIDAINSKHPNILLVGLSVPKEHKFVVDNFQKLDTNVIITCGGYIEQTATSGIDYYPHPWIYKFHLNWIYRILKEPKRLWKRYFVQGLWYIWWLPSQIIKSKFKRI